MSKNIQYIIYFIMVNLFLSSKKNPKTRYIKEHGRNKVQFLIHKNISQNTVPQIDDY